MKADKVLVIQQYFGLGDIIWGQSIAHNFIKNDYKVLWPVQPSLVEGLNRAYPCVTFIDHTWLNINFENKDFKEENGVRMLPMRYSEWLMGRQYRDHMKSKYEYLNMDWRTWKQHAMPVRYPEKEKDLRNAIGIKRGEKFNLIAVRYGSDGNHQINLNITNGFKNVVLDFVPGYSLFDWCSVIENATTIHAVSSSTLYLFELLDLQATEVHLYPRQPHEQNFDYTKFLMTKSYILHD